jgi:nitrite reductase/ring-hydroxylating ferredoxin subunit
MKKYTKDQIVSRLKTEGVRFSEFSVVHVGTYEVSDADWNYKDVPHLHYVHELAEAIPAVVGDDIIATINLQKVLGFRFPFSLFNYESGPNAQTYYTTWLFYILIIETTYEALGHGRTRVNTTYTIGYPRILGWTMPILRWVLRRNYDILMSTDIPMRTRRGELRAWGYTFSKSTPTYSFEKTMDITVSNVVSPIDIKSPEPVTIKIDEVFHADGEYLVGRNDHFGLRLVRNDGTLKAYPRMCPHEGASLDGEPCVGDRLMCPWHGRRLNAIATFRLGQSAAEQRATDNHTLTLDANVLTITHISRKS